MDNTEHAAPVRLTVSLSPKTLKALNDAAEWQEETKTDVVNKAIRLYGELLSADRAGQAFYIRTLAGLTGEGELERVRFI